jgi:transcription factor YY
MCTEPECNMIFHDAQTLKDHVTQHTWGPYSIESGDMGEKSFVCLSCSKRMCDRKVLRKHLLTHQERRFVCEIDGCGAKFYERAKLKRHMLVHTGEKAFRCTFPMCCKQFAYKANLKTHLRTHTGSKPFSCSFPGCDKTFAQASNRNAHMQVHKKPSRESKNSKNEPQAAVAKDESLHERNECFQAVNQPHGSTVLFEKKNNHNIAFMDQSTDYRTRMQPMGMPLSLQLHENFSPPPASRAPSLMAPLTSPNTNNHPLTSNSKAKPNDWNNREGVPFPLDLSSIDSIRSSELYSMLPTPGSFIGNSIFNFEASA